MFVSVTRLRLKRKRSLPLFIWYTLSSIRQSRKTAGLMHSSFVKEGWHTYWTLTVWSDEMHMKSFRNSGNHLKAMKISRKIASELEYSHWESNNVPSWVECRERLHEKYKRKLS